jgi:hypothetical protein
LLQRESYDAFPGAESNMYRSEEEHLIATSEGEDESGSKSQNPQAKQQKARLTPYLWVMAVIVIWSILPQVFHWFRGPGVCAFCERPQTSSLATLVSPPALISN